MVYKKIKKYCCFSNIFVILQNMMLWKRIKNLFRSRKHKWMPLMLYRASLMVRSFLNLYEVENPDTIDRATMEFLKYLLMDEKRYLEFFNALHENDERSGKKVKISPTDDYVYAEKKVRMLLQKYKDYRFKEMCDMIYKVHKLPLSSEEKYLRIMDIRNNRVWY